MVVLPGPHAGACMLTVSSPIQAVPTGALRVLLIEDSPVIREAVGEMIEADGQARVAFATDSESTAVRELGTARYDVVIVDLQLREGSGFGVLRALQGLKPDSLVIVLTNYASPAVRQRCSELGAHCFLDKSSEFEAIPGLLSGWAQRHSQAP